VAYSFGPPCTSGTGVLTLEVTPENVSVPATFLLLAF